MACGCKQSVPELTPEQIAEREERLRRLAEEQEQVRIQREEEHRRDREERLYARRIGRT